MTAEPIATTAPWRPDPIRQGRADHTLEDVLDLPEDAPRVELVHGVLHVVPSPTEEHQNITGLLWSWLRTNAPSGYRAVLGVGVALSQRDSRIPDVVLRRTGGGTNRSMLSTDEIVIAIEIVSPGTRRADRFHKPAEYATAGIPYYWRIEQNPIHIHAYQLGDHPSPDGRRIYEPVADSAHLLKLDDPFPIALPISDITP